ncbi:unnamed protein product, partial [Closterium sp. Naga37s-1]
AAFFTAGATTASATLLAPLLSRGGNISAAASAAQARPLVWKGKVVEKYVAKMHATKSKGKLIGDSGAWGKLVLKSV